MLLLVLAQVAGRRYTAQEAGVGYDGAELLRACRLHMCDFGRVLY